jgi:hypothetical protein
MDELGNSHESAAVMSLPAVVKAAGLAKVPVAAFVTSFPGVPGRPYVGVLDWTEAARLLSKAFKYIRHSMNHTDKTLRVRAVRTLQKMWMQTFMHKRFCSIPGNSVPLYGPNGACCYPWQGGAVAPHDPDH